MGENGFSQYHPAVNFLFFMVAIGGAVVIQHPWYLVVSLGAGTVYYLLLLGKKGLKMLGALLPAAAVIGAMNPLFNLYGKHVLFSVFGRPYTAEALLYGAVLAGIFADMMIWFGCYNQVLTSDKFTSLFGRLIPSLSLLLVMVLRMIPGMIRKTKQIAGARKSIGKGLSDGGSLRKRIGDGVAVLSVMTDWALEGSVITADSMRARGYGSGKRTSFQNYTMGWRDWGMLAVMAALTGITLLGGSVEASFTPSVYIAPLSWGIYGYALLLLIPSIITIKEAALWHILRSGI